ncbi:MAG TPA: thioesterase family protein [Longimicrobiales bacterium]|nr:thioesterase family protein [Longimicrobiales bacterium]
MSNPFKFSWRVPVRFHDLDAMGHAHHTLPIVYFEEARAAYWREVAGRDSVGEIDYVIAEMRVQFKQRILYPAVLTVRTGITHVGNASFTMSYELLDEEGALLATGESIQVMFDYSTGKSMRMPAETRTRIESYEGIGS